MQTKIRNASFSLHINVKDTREKTYNLNGLYFTRIHVLIRKISTTKKPTIVDGIATFLLLAYLKRIDHMDIMSPLAFFQQLP
jgi:hypothetical protein